MHVLHLFIDNFLLKYDRKHNKLYSFDVICVIEQLSSTQLNLFL